MSARGYRRVLATIDAHAGGKPLRLITSDVPRLRGATILERRQEMLEQHDDLRRVLMFEPRGHSDMYGAILTPPVTDEADYGILFMHNEGYSSMCGHGIVAVPTILVETAQFPANAASATIGYDTPAGFVRARATIADGRVSQVAFGNVPSFVYAEAVPVKTSFGACEVPVLFGGAFYALAPAPATIAVEPSNVRALIEFGMAVKHAVEGQVEVIHPVDPGLQRIYGTIITDRPTDGTDGEVDRSPCGTGTAARLAWLRAQGQLPVERPYVHESIIGSRFTGRVLHETLVGDRPAIVAEIAGSASITGYHTFVVDPDDRIGHRFLVR